MSRTCDALSGGDDLFTYRAKAAKADEIDGVPPDVRDLFEALALQVAAAGLRHYSARALLHRMRWHHHVERGDPDFKVNNMHSAPLARWFMKRHPELPDFFETRGDDA